MTYCLEGSCSIQLSYRGSLFLFAVQIYKFYHGLKATLKKIPAFNRDSIL